MRQVGPLKVEVRDLTEGVPVESQINRLIDAAANNSAIEEALKAYIEMGMEWNTFLFWLVDLCLISVQGLSRELVRTRIADAFKERQRKEVSKN